MDFLFHFLTFNWRHSPKSLSSAETDLVESTTVQQLWAGVTTKKLIFRHFLNSSKLSAKSVQVILPYTSNASDSHTVLHTLCMKGTERHFYAFWYLMLLKYVFRVETIIGYILFCKTRQNRFCFHYYSSFFILESSQVPLGSPILSMI
jgi:hypothetical protein